MKCNDFRDRIDNHSTLGLSREMEQHSSQCDDCRAYFETIDQLTPRVYPKAPAELKTRVLAKIRRNEQFKAFITMKTKVSRITAFAATLVVGLFTVAMLGSSSSARGAEKMIDKSLASFTAVKSMVMLIDVRTDINENFAYVSVNEPFVEHKLTVVRDVKSMWRLEKGWRSIVCDGSTKYMWTPDGVMKVKGSVDNGFEEWFSILLDPEMTLLYEKASLMDKGSVYVVNEVGNEIIMSAMIKAKGDFSNPYILNTSIETSDTRREIIFDKNTNLIKSIKVFVVDKSREILVLDVKDIKYNVPIDTKMLVEIPSNLAWVDVNKVPSRSGLFIGITPLEASKIIFRALEESDPNKVKDAFYTYDINSIFEEYGGLTLVKLGKPFKSGDYCGFFIPYVVKMPNGKIYKNSIALRNDNRKKSWVVDGGI